MTVVASTARADKITDAEDLFRRAKALMAQKKDDEACPLLSESYRLDPGVGTLLNLALCHERIGKTASAWGEFRSVEQQAHAASPPNETRARFARDHAAKLQTRLSRVQITVPAEARVPGLVIKVDGEAKGEPLWAGVPVDPGTRVVEASATNKKPVTLAALNAPNVVNNHAYTLVSASIDPNGTTHYRIRNPWGSSGDALEDSHGYATLTFAQLVANFTEGCVAA